MQPGDKEHIKVLLVEDNPADAVLIRRMLSETDEGYPDIRHSKNLSSALESLAERTFYVVVLDLALPDSHGLYTFLKAHTQYPEVPVIVMTATSDGDLSVRAVQARAQDYLVKGQFDLKAAIINQLENAKIRVDGKGPEPGQS